MGDTSISGLGKILSGNEASVSVNQLKEDDVKVEFSEIMTQSNLKNLYTQNLSNNAETPVQRKAEASLETPPSADYEKFQYKDNKIPEKTEYKDVAVGSEVEEKMSEFSEQVKEVLKEELGVSEEEITSAMETLGLSYADLLNQNNLANLVAELTGNSDICGLLCNEQFLNVLQGVNVLSQELLQNLGMSMEELIGFLNAQSVEGTVGDALTEINSDAGLQNDTVSTGETVESNTVVTEENTTSEATVLESEAEVTEEAVSQNTTNTKAASEETATETGKTVEETTNTENVVSDDVSVEVVKTDETKQQDEETSDEQLPQGEQTQTSVTEDTADEKTKKTTFRQIVKETNEQVSEGVQVNQNTNVNQVNGAEVVQNIPETMNMREIMNQLVDAARVTVSTDLTKMEMQLNPENLGKMYLEIVEKDGIISAKIQLQNEAVKEAVEAQIVELRQNLNQAGVKVDAVEVTVASHEFEKNLEQDAKREEQQAGEQEKATKQRRINLNNLDELSGLMTEEESLVAKMMAEQGNSIDFTA